MLENHENHTGNQRARQLMKNNRKHKNNQILMEHRRKAQWKTIGKAMGKPLANLKENYRTSIRETISQPVKNHKKTIGKPKESLWKTNGFIQITRRVHSVDLLNGFIQQVKSVGSLVTRSMDSINVFLQRIHSMDSLSWLIQMTRSMDPYTWICQWPQSMESLTQAHY